MLHWTKHIPRQTNSNLNSWGIRIFEIHMRCYRCSSSGLLGRGRTSWDGGGREPTKDGGEIIQGRRKQMSDEADELRPRRSTPALFVERPDFPWKRHKRYGTAWILCQVILDWQNVWLINDEWSENEVKAKLESVLIHLGSWFWSHGPFKPI